MKSLLIILAVLTTAAALAAESPVREPSPMVAEIQAAYEAARTEVADLQARYESTSDPEHAREIQNEAIRVKHEVRVEVMRIQLRYAQARGDMELAAELQEIVTRMTAPPARGLPQPRRGND